MNQKITFYSTEPSMPAEILSKYSELFNIEAAGVSNAVFENSDLGIKNYEFYSWKSNPDNSKPSWYECSYPISEENFEDAFFSFLTKSADSISTSTLLEYTASSDKETYLVSIDQKYNDICGSNHAIKFFATTAEIASAYPAIKELFVNHEKLLTTIIGTYPGNNGIEIRYEFADDPNFETLLKPFKKKYPGIRLLGVTKASAWENQVMYISGNGNNKIMTKKVKYQDSWSSDYDHLTSGSDYWANPQFHEQDFYFKQDGSNTTLAFVNDFNWSKTVDLSSLSFDLTAIGKKAFVNKKELKEIIFPYSLIKLEKDAFMGCTNLTHVFFKSNAKIAKDVFDGCKKLTIHGAAGSYEEEYAKQNGIPFITG